MNQDQSNEAFERVALVMAGGLLVLAGVVVGALCQSGRPEALAELPLSLPGLAGFGT